MSNLAKNYTHADVERLVGQVKDTMRTGTISHYYLNEALEPFQPDPEEELIELVNTIRNTSGNFDDRSRQIIAAVRDHDAKHWRSS